MGADVGRHGEMACPQYCVDGIKTSVRELVEQWPKGKKVSELDRQRLYDLLVEN